MTVSLYIAGVKPEPEAVKVSTVTIPVMESMVIPGTVGEIDQRLLKVPYVATNAGVLIFRPRVTVKVSAPPLMTTSGLMVIVN